MKHVHRSSRFFKGPEASDFEQPSACERVKDDLKVEVSPLYLHASQKKT